MALRWMDCSWDDMVEAIALLRQFCDERSASMDAERTACVEWEKTIQLHKDACAQCPASSSHKGFCHYGAELRRTILETLRVWNRERSGQRTQPDGQ